MFQFRAGIRVLVEENTMRALTLALLCLPLIGCPTDSGSDDDDSTAEDPTPEPTPEIADPSAVEDPSGTCPTFEDGMQTFTSAGLERQVLVSLPDDLEPGAPVVFFWHSFGTDANYWFANYGLDSLANDTGAIVLLPQALEKRFFEWDWVSDPTSGEWNEGAFEDVAVFDDLRNCAVQELEADVRRIYTAGFSAGAVWSTFLTMHRSDMLAAAYLMSGGNVVNLPWVSPEHPIPTVAMEGGEADVWPSPAAPVANFHEGTLTFAENMLAEDQFVVRCTHSSGHSPGPGARQWMEEFLMRHSYGEESPFAGDRAGDIPSPECWDAADGDPN
jgi:predicted esterase